MAIFVTSEPGLIQTASFNLAVDITSLVQNPTYALILTGSLTTLRASSYLDILFYGNVLILGAVPAGANIAVSFRLVLNGTPIVPSRAGTTNQPNQQIHGLALSRRVVVAQGLQTIRVEWTRFAGGAAATMNCSPFTLPDLMGAHLRLQEQT